MSSTTVPALGVDSLDHVEPGDRRPDNLMISNLYPWCMALQGGDRHGWMCSRNKGHNGPHIAANDVVYAVWR